MWRRVSNTEGGVIDVEGQVCISLVVNDHGENHQAQ